jgi:LEA14-like dessication related protein
VAIKPEILRLKCGIALRGVSMRVCAALIACGAFSACSLVAPKFERPVLSVVSIQMTGGNLLQQNFLVKLNVENPNDRALPVTSLHVEMHVAGEEIAHGSNNQPFVVPAHGENQFDMTITANAALVILKLAASRNSHADAIDYDLTGGASLDLPFFRDLPFHQSGSLPLKGLQ